MGILNVKEKEPELKLKKEPEIDVHKGNLTVKKKEQQIICRKEAGFTILGKKYEEESENEKSQETAQGKNLYGDTEKRPYGILASVPANGKYTHKKDGRIKESGIPKKKTEHTGNDQSGFNPRIRESQNNSNLRTGGNQNRNMMTNTQAEADYRRKLKIREFSENLKIRSVGAEPGIRVNHPKGLPAAVGKEGGEPVRRNNLGMDRTVQPGGTSADRSGQAQTGERPKLTGKKQKGAEKKKAADKFLRKEGKKKRNVFRQKGENRAIRQRKLRFMLNQLSGSEEQDSLGQTVKDIIRMKASALLVKTAQNLGVLLAPLSGMVFLAAFPVVLIVVLLYGSPIAAFMENPSADTPSIQEVLGGYYMEFNQTVSANAGKDGAVSYLHEKDGNYVSNYMDTLMVYMVQYGTGDLGVIMDEKHKRLLKKVFDEMNRFEDQTVTTTVQAGQSLGNVVTSAYCACSICCGQWAGDPTASGALPKADHTIAVDAADPFVPMGTRIIMGGKEYVVEDTGAFARYGVQFDIYFDSHETASRWGHVTMEAFLAEGNENTVSVTKKGSYVRNLNFEDYIALGKLNRDQEELLREVMSADFRSEIPSSGAGSDVANLALTKVGCQYSQERRYEEGYYDCSSLVQRCYAQFGISLPAIASTQGQYMVEHGLEVTEDMLEPGDVIFYSYENNGQFRNISHVAIYIGNGRMVHASSPERGVVNDPFSPSNVGLYGRPGRGRQ